MVGLVRGFKGLKTPSTFTVSSNTQNIQIDHPYQILWTLLPEDSTNTDIFWNSSDESIATVDELGLITPVSVGECTITGHTASNWLIQTIAVTTYVVHTTGVSLDKDSIMVLPDTPVQLTATATPSNTNFPEVIWSSSNTSIATVDDNGLVTFVGTGNCTITCTTVDGGYTDTCDVETGIPVESVSLDIHSSIIYNGSSIQLTATVLPIDASNKNVTWSSSNTAVATVTDNGLVTFVGTGNCTITVTTEQGGLTDTCSISCQIFQPVDRCFGYTGAEQSISLKPHKYCLEVWGASGGTQNNSGSRGGYSGGCITLNSESCVYIYVGGQGAWYWCGSLIQSSGGYNGGGGIYGCGCAATGGGGTDIRIGGKTLYHRRIVAGGGAGQGYEYSNGGAGGGITGVNGNPWSSNYARGLGGTQTAAGGYSGRTGGCCQCLNKGAGFGTGGMGAGWPVGGGGGGGGWYGGGGGNISGGGGGSGYVYTSSTCSSAPSGYCHCTDYFLTNAYTCCGNVSFPTPSGGTETGHSGCGCVRIRSI